MFPYLDERTTDKHPSGGHHGRGMPDDAPSTLRRVILPGVLLALLVAGASLIALAVVVNLGRDQRLPLRFGTGGETVTLRQGSAGVRDPGRRGHQRSASRGGRLDPGPPLISEPGGAATLVPGDATAGAGAPRTRRQAQLRRNARRRAARPRRPARRPAAQRPIVVPPAAAPPAAAAPTPALASVPAAAASPAPPAGHAPIPDAKPAKRPNHGGDDGDDGDGDDGHDAGGDEGRGEDDDGEDGRGDDGDGEEGRGDDGDGDEGHGDDGDGDHGHGHG